MAQLVKCGPRALGNGPARDDVRASDIVRAIRAGGRAPALADEIHGAMRPVKEASRPAHPARRNGKGGGLRAQVRSAVQQHIAPSGQSGQRVKPIEEIKVGDLVWAWDETARRRVKRRVVRLFKRQDRPVLKVVCGSDSGGLQTVEATTEHPFWVEGRGWTAANELRHGDRLRQISGQERLPVVHVVESELRIEVFNFEVEGAHCYFVGGTGVLVHNESSPRQHLGADDTTLLRLTSRSAQTMNPGWRAQIYPRAAEGLASEAVTHLWQLARESANMLPQSLREPVRLSNGSLTSSVITSLDLNAGYGPKKGAFKAWTLLDDGGRGSYPMGVATNLPGADPISVLAEATLTRHVAQHIPNFMAENVVYVATPRIVDTPQGPRVVFDTAPRGAELGIGMLMEAGMPGRIFKGKSVVDILNKAGKLDDAIPGYESFKNHEPGVTATAVFGHAVLLDPEPLVARARENVGLLIQKFPNFDEGARPLIEATRRMVDQEGVAVVDGQYMPSYPRAWTDPVGGRIRTVTARNLDPLEIVRAGQVHPTASMGDIDLLQWDFDQWGAHNLLSVRLIEVMVDAKQGRSR